VTPGRFAGNPPSIGPAATIHASIGDWARYIIEHLRGAQGQDGKLLKEESYQRLHRRKRIGANWQEDYILGWMVVYRSWARGESSGDKGRCLHHAGSNNSWYALAWLAPERDFAVIATTKIGGDVIFPKIGAVRVLISQV
jgi:CubicO group peptidase (beta-lactamase class C family)